MKIDDIIRKCIEIPGISIQRSDFSTELLLKETKEGKGSMTFFPLFPGVTIAYIFVNSPTWTAPNFREDSSIRQRPFALKLLCNWPLRNYLEQWKLCICEGWRNLFNRAFCSKAICISAPHL